MYQPTQLKKTTTPSVQNSIKPSSLRYGFLFILLASLASTANALPPPVCPGPECQKVITIYNNTSGPIFAAIQAGKQNPDPWLQAVFQDSQNPYAETHLSRVYINPTNGIPPGGSVKVTVPWYSHLQNDVDEYADWFNGCRVVIFDSQAAVQLAHRQDMNHPLTLTAGSPQFSCATCDPQDPLTLYADPVAYADTNFPFQLLEYSFYSVAGNPPEIANSNVNYNTSYVDQIYLPIALAPCKNEPCGERRDVYAVGYLGTTQTVDAFRDKLRAWLQDPSEGWVRYNSPLDGLNNPRIPSAYLALIDQVNVQEKHQPSHYFPDPLPDNNALKKMINQWRTCTTGQPDPNACPGVNYYREVNDYFNKNYATYNPGHRNRPPECTGGPNEYPNPDRLTSLNIMPYVYGWVPFNSGCPANFNDLLTHPGPKAVFDQVQSHYIHNLEYNYDDVPKDKRFNPYVELVHGSQWLKADIYAFSIDDTVGFQSRAGEGLIITVGGPHGLPNPNPIMPDNPDYTSSFKVVLGDSRHPPRPRWTSYGVCKDVADTDFPPVPPGQPDSPSIFVNTKDNHISNQNPCTITIKDAANRTYQFKVKKEVPWNAWEPRNGFDPSVLECVNADNWCQYINEEAKPSKPEFILFTRPPL